MVVHFFDPAVIMQANSSGMKFNLALVCSVYYNSIHLRFRKWLLRVLVKIWNSNPCSQLYSEYIQIILIIWKISYRIFNQKHVSKLKYLWKIYKLRTKISKSKILTKSTKRLSETKLENTETVELKSQTYTQHQTCQSHKSGTNWDRSYTITTN